MRHLDKKRRKKEQKGDFLPYKYCQKLKDGIALFCTIWHKFAIMKDRKANFYVLKKYICIFPYRTFFFPLPIFKPCGFHLPLCCWYHTEHFLISSPSPFHVLEEGEAKVLHGYISLLIRKKDHMERNNKCPFRRRGWHLQGKQRRSRMKMIFLWYHAI